MHRYYWWISYAKEGQGKYIVKWETFKRATTDTGEPCGIPVGKWFTECNYEREAVLIASVLRDSPQYEKDMEITDKAGNVISF